MTTTTAIERMSDTRLQQRIDMNRDAKFGLENATVEQLNVIFVLCKHLRLDPLTDMTLFQGRPWRTLDGELRLLHRHPEYVTHKQWALSEQEKLDGGWNKDDVVWATEILKTNGHSVIQWGKITRAEIETGQGRRTPHGMHPVEMAQKRSLARARKFAFGGEEQLDQTQIEEILATETALRGDREKTKALAAKYVQIYGTDDGDIEAKPIPERDPELQDALIDNETLLIDARDIGVGQGVLKRCKADPEKWSLSDIREANNELRSSIRSHQEL